MKEFSLVINDCSLLERAAGVRLHRNVTSGKLQFLALGCWIGTLQQENIPYQLIRLCEELNFIRVGLKSTFTQTRKSNCETLVDRVCKTIGP